MAQLLRETRNKVSGLFRILSGASGDLGDHLTLNLVARTYEGDKEVVLNLLTLRSPLRQLSIAFVGFSSPPSPISRFVVLNQTVPRSSPLHELNTIELVGL